MNCRHENYAPAGMFLKICMDCGAVLDHAWGCDECEFEVPPMPARTFAGIKINVVNARPCLRHQEAQ